MAFRKQSKEEPNGHKSRSMKTKLQSEDQRKHLLPSRLALHIYRIASSEVACPYSNSTCRHGRLFHFATVVGETYGIDQGIAAWCEQCEVFCSFELLSGPSAVPKPKFTAKEAVVESGERPFEPALGMLFLGKSRRAEGLQSPGAQP